MTSIRSESAREERLIPLRHPWRWVAAVVLLAAAVWWVVVLVTTPAFQWDVVGKYLFSNAVLAGVGNTLLITALSMAIGVTLGTTVAVMRLSPNPVLNAVAGVYIWFFRGTPTLVQLIFWFNLAALFPRIQFGAAGFYLVDADTNAIMTPLVAALLGLGLNVSAYYSEIVRSGILSIDEGQSEAAAAYGFSRAQTLRYVILPQAMRVIIPPTGNELIGLLKWSSMASVISYSELLHSVTVIYSRTFEVIPLLVVATIWYLAMTTVLSIGQYFVERHFARGAHRTPPPTFFAIVKRQLHLRRATS